MKGITSQIRTAGVRLGLTILSGLGLLMVTLFTIGNDLSPVSADPIDPPEGYPKLSLSVKTVTPTLAGTGGATLAYAIEVRNTGAYTATGTTLTDLIPDNTVYNDGSAQASSGPPPIFDGGTSTLAWNGDVGFDATVVISFSVTVDAAFSGVVRNTATISHALIPKPVTAMAETMVTDEPVLVIGKTVEPDKPGANKPLVYTIVVTNLGQSTPDNLLITVTDRLPANTSSPSPGPDGVVDGELVTWARNVSLDTGETTVFTFSTVVDSVISGTVITNADYQVVSPLSGVAVGEAYTVTVIDPILWLSKEVRPDPPGSNRDATYILTLLNTGSLATNLVITDRVPAGVTYQDSDGSLVDGIVSWSLASLDTGQSAQFTYTVSISDVANIEVVNDDYAVCSAEGICQRGKPLTNTVKAAAFEVNALLDPMAKKPGAGNTPVTPTLVIHNLGPGNARGAQAVLYFDQMNVSDPGSITVIRSDGSSVPGEGITVPPGEEKHCGTDCWVYYWAGDLDYQKSVTFTVLNGTNTTTGDIEGATYTATIVISDTLGDVSTPPVTATAVGTVTLQANLIPTKSAPPAIGHGQRMTYTLSVFNSGVTVDGSPGPYLWDLLPINGVTVLPDSISHGGQIQEVLSGTSEIMVISWTLPALATGERLPEARSFAVLVNDDLVSGTQILNNYQVVWYEAEDADTHSNGGPPAETTVQDVGLIDSYKEVTPTLALPGSGNVLTYQLHIVNSSGVNLSGVTVDDILPWETSTYQRDAIASAGQIISDIVSIHWTGSVGAFSSESVTFTVEVDPDYQGPLTNTATVDHPDLPEPIEVQAVAYVTDQPVLQITKSASPDPVEQGGELTYVIRVVNLGHQATNLVITDTIPANTTYVAGSATDGGQVVSDKVRWEMPLLKPGDDHTFGFQVTVESGSQVINDQYAVTSAEGTVGIGAPVITSISRGGNDIYLPIVLKNG